MVIVRSFKKTCATPVTVKIVKLFVFK